MGAGGWVGGVIPSWDTRWPSISFDMAVPVHARVPSPSEDMQAVERTRDGLSKGAETLGWRLWR